MIRKNRFAVATAAGLAFTMAGVTSAEASTSAFFSKGGILRSQAHALQGAFKVYDEAPDGWGAIGRLNFGSGWTSYYNGNGYQGGTDARIKTWSITRHGWATLDACSIDNGVSQGCGNDAQYLY